MASRNTLRWDYMAEKEGRRVWCIAGRPPLVFSLRAAAEACIADYVSVDDRANVETKWVQDAGGYVIFRRKLPPKGPTWALYR